MAEGVIKKDPENKRLSKMNSLNTDKLLALSINDKNTRIDRKEILKTQGKLFRTKNSANNLNIPLNDGNIILLLKWDFYIILIDIALIMNLYYFYF